MSFTLDSLTPRSISTILSLQSADKDRTFQPIVQVLSLKAVAQDRYCTVLSDGVHFTHGMVAPKLKEYIENGELRVNSIVKITDFMNNQVQDRKIVILFQLQVLGMASQRLGDPQDWKASSSSNTMVPGRSTAPVDAAAPMYNRTNTAGWTGMISSSSTPIIRGMTTSSEGGTPLTLISNLNLDQNRWTIKAQSRWEIGYPKMV